MQHRAMPCSTMYFLHAKPHQHQGCPPRAQGAGCPGCPVHAWTPPVPHPHPQPGSRCGSLLVFITLLRAEHEQPNLE